MDTSDIVWIVVAVLVLLAIAALIAATTRRRKAGDDARAREHAQHLRTEAAAKSSSVQESRIEAQEAELRAERARLEAQKEQERAEQVKRGHLAEQARVEDQVREADRLDPDVDHHSADYSPTAPHPGATGATGTEGPTGAAGRHASGDPVSGQQEVVHESHDETVHETDPDRPEPPAGGSGQLR